MTAVMSFINILN